MTTSGPGGELAIRMNLYGTLEERARSRADLGDLTAQHPYRLEAGWSPAGPDAHVDMDLTGASGVEEIQDLARALMVAATELFEHATEIEQQAIDVRFTAIVDPPECASEAADEPDAPQGVFPGWADMPMLDRALAVEHIRQSRATGSTQQPPALTYAVDDQLRSLPADYAHLHAVHLEHTLGIPESLNAATRAELERLARDYHDQESR
ncbi:hypothetical protein [Brachybacterium paraconglomeratum]|uniref:hypothetical protein n=1 Tax=Brachybacterium paraconglomeratum TaxID=173362 RepID=UPI0022AF0DBB|nr:hypothetical protein [Brachybacterium paraconglomeratum]MCZ4326747.1 hypothetical protein [Brachybacterium paraconglomeratum]